MSKEITPEMVKDAAHHSNWEQYKLVYRKELANIERQARIDEWNLISETLHSAGIQAELFLNRTRKDRIKELERE